MRGPRYTMVLDFAALLAVLGCEGGCEGAMERRFYLVPEGEPAWWKGAAQQAAVHAAAAAAASNWRHAGHHYGHAHACLDRAEQWRRDLLRVAASRAMLLDEARRSGRSNWPPLADEDCAECGSEGDESPHLLSCSIGRAERRAILAAAV